MGITRCSFDDSDPVTIDSGDCGLGICSVHGDSPLTIPPESEIIVPGKFNAELCLKKIVWGVRSEVVTESEVGCRKSEVRSQKSEVRGLKS